MTQYKKTHKLNPQVLRAYDIRGSVDETLFYEDAYYIAKAFVTKVIAKTGKKNPKIGLGFDGRLSTPKLQAAAVEGMLAAGADVTNVGLGPSPMLYFTVRSLQLDGGMMITGSHNPGHHNGFKMMYDKAPLFDTEIKDIGRITESGEFAEGQGSETKKSIYEDYIKNLLTAFEAPANNSKKLKIVWDAGNGATGEVLEQVVKHIDAEHILLNTKVDGTFPAHHPDPTEPKNLVQLIDEVKKNNADVGIAFDGDGDRIGAVDGTGRIIWGDQLLTIFAEDVLAAKPGSTIIADVKASIAFSQTVKKLGGTPLVWKTGHSYIKNKLSETGAPLAGEISGHIFFADRYWGFDDALYAAMRLLNFLFKTGKSISDIVDGFPVAFNTPEYRLNVNEEDKFRIIDEIKEKVKATANDEQAISEIDGIRVDSKNGWWLVRASNTQSAITARIEADSKANLDIQAAELNGFLANYGLKINLNQ